MPTARDFKVFAGNSNLPLARRICEHLKRPLGKAEVGRFSDGEIQIEIGENVRGQDTFIIQSTCPPANDHIMELLIMCDALKRASAQSITAVLSNQTLTENDSGNTVTAGGNINSGQVTLQSGAFQGFSGIGNWVINTGHNNNLMGNLSVSINMAPAGGS